MDKTKKSCRILITEEYYQQLFIRTAFLIGPVSYVLTENKTDFRKKYTIIKIGLFGSFADNRSIDQSDIDLLVEYEPDTEMLFEKKIILKELLKKRFNADVDICREKYIKKYYRKQILKSVIYV